MFITPNPYPLPQTGDIVIQNTKILKDINKKAINNAYQKFKYDLESYRILNKNNQVIESGSYVEIEEPVKNITFIGSKLQNLN